MLYFSYSCIYSYSCYIFIFIFMIYFSYSCIYIHIHVIFLNSYSCYIFHIYCFFYIHIHVIIFTFMYLYSPSCYIFIFMVMLCMVLFIHIHGLFSRHERIWMHHFTFIFSSPKSILCFNNSKQCILVWSSCLDQPRVHLKVPDDVMPSITSTVSHNFALSNQQISWRSGMSFALHQEGHRFGRPSAHIFMLVIFSVLRFSLALCVSTKQAIKRKLPAKLWPLGDKNLR